MRAMQSGWVTACEERIAALGRGKMMFPEITGEQRLARDREYDKEISRWRRKLFWAKYGYIRAAGIGLVVGGGLGYFLVAFLLP